jgi:outer membrane protein assembly factor BamB
MNRFAVVTLALSSSLAACGGSSDGAGALPTTSRPVASSDWVTYAGDSQRTGFNPSEKTIGPQNVSRLHPLWTFTLSTVSDTQPLVVSGLPSNGKTSTLVYVGDENGNLYAVDASTGQQVWTRQLGAYNRTGCNDIQGGMYGITGAPAIDRANRRMFVVDGQAMMYALDLATGKSASDWPSSGVSILGARGTASQDHDWGAVTYNAATATVYATTASYCDRRPYYGRAVAVNASNGTVENTLFTSGANGGAGIWGWGGVSVDPRNGTIYIATGNAYPNDTDPNGDAIISAPANLSTTTTVNVPPGVTGSPDLDFGSTPSVFTPPGCPTMFAVERKDGMLFLYNADRIGAGPVQSIAAGNSAGHNEIGVTAYANGLLYMSNAAVGTYPEGLLAFTIGAPSCTLQFLWSQPFGAGAFYESAPTIANGVVYVNGGGRTITLAFDAGTGTPLWVSPGANGWLIAAPTVSNGQLYSVGWDHTLHAYGI